ncbi:MbtH family protein [Microbispora hainanensis]|jgi:MbtH protein|uniref:MbtH family protein n=1 Tax=Microbispora hainanensis TaxID=568844 RepID=UPI0032460E95
MTDSPMLVVVNDEEQYSIWWSDREPPAGWRATGFTGTRQECLDHIETVWTDMRPLSARDPETRSVRDPVTSGSRDR